MARARNIKPSFFTNDVLAEISALGRLLFIGMWTIADREGRMEDRPKKIKAEVLPYDDCDVDGLLNDLVKHGFILRYAVGNNKYIQILTFTKHQNPHVKEAESTIPAPDSHHTITIQDTTLTGTIPADSLLLIPDCGSTRAQPDSNPEKQTISPTKAGEVCKALREVGIAKVNPSHPTLTALLDSGVTVQEFIDVAGSVSDDKKSFAYILSVVRNRHEDAARLRVVVNPYADSPVRPGDEYVDGDEIPDGWDWVWRKDGKKALYPAGLVDVGSRLLDPQKAQEARKVGAL